ncbi:MAG: glycosyltransferase family 9 protein [Candidatus Kapabacteria bacterium]|nr:glycosyltransferase family 9 protein [Candidatus Kapabacteria bacterium]
MELLKIPNPEFLKAKKKLSQVKKSLEFNIKDSLKKKDCKVGTYKNDYMIDFAELRNIVVFQTAFLGDIVLSLPLVQTLKNLLPNSTITFVSSPIALQILNYSEAIDKVIIFDKRNSHKGLKGIKILSDEIKSLKPDLILSPHRSMRSSLVNYFAKPKYSVSFNTSSLSFLYDKKVKYHTNLHEIDRNLSLLSPFINNDDFSANKLIRNLSDVKIRVSKEDIDFVQNILRENNVDTDNFVTLSPGSVWETKKWPKENYIDLCILLTKQGFSPVLTGSAADSELCEGIADKSGAINLSGMTTLIQSIVLLKLSRALISNDSAPAHLAGLVACPVIMIYGPTSPIFGFYPRGTKDIVLQDEKLECRPCAIHGGRKCPLGHFNCMKNISPEMVIDNLSIFFK